MEYRLRVFYYRLLKCNVKTSPVCAPLRWNCTLHCASRASLLESGGGWTRSRGIIAMLYLSLYLYSLLLITIFFIWILYCPAFNLRQHSHNPSAKLKTVDPKLLSRLNCLPIKVTWFVGNVRICELNFTCRLCGCVPFFGVIWIRISNPRLDHSASKKSMNPA